MSNFATELKAQLLAQPKMGRRATRILNIIDARPSRRRTRQLTRMESCAIGTIAQPTVLIAAIGDSGFDWSMIDWFQFLGPIISTLLKLLPLILGA